MVGGGILYFDVISTDQPKPLYSLMFIHFSTEPWLGIDLALIFGYRIYLQHRTRTRIISVKSSYIQRIFLITYTIIRVMFNSMENIKLTSLRYCLFGYFLFFPINRDYTRRPISRLEYFDVEYIIVTKYETRIFILIQHLCLKNIIFKINYH